MELQIAAWGCAKSNREKAGGESGKRLPRDPAVLERRNELARTCLLLRRLRSAQVTDERHRFPASMPQTLAAAKRFRAWAGPMRHNYNGLHLFSGHWNQHSVAG